MPTKKKTVAKSVQESDLKLDLLPGLIGYQLRLAQLAVFGDFAAELKAFDISPGRFGVLVLISANPGMTQSLLASATQLDRSTMVAVIDQLEARNLVERRASPTDRRSNALVLTADGENLLKLLKRRIKKHEARIAAAMTPAESATLVQLLTRIRTKLQSAPSRPKRTAK
ncbi:MAG: MarR family transcriptional regulator [Rhodocyclaceae bacterium]|nr:MarR family transcriptional regulator [Rhodocyclaceae bacterium]MBX3678203.1 MarR family transcriptional regulator [Rhodocyclaceae bacterium]MBZ0132316.1 MarR family transcriptional regulator [Rhodocyclaceae bacterium]